MSSDPHHSHLQLLQILKSTEPVIAPGVPEPVLISQENAKLVHAYRVSVDVRVNTPDNNWRILSFRLDSGAEISVLPKQVARSIGFKDSDWKQGKRVSVSCFDQEGHEVPQVKGWETELVIRIGNSDSVKIPAIVVDVEKMDPLLGRKGVFDHFYFGFAWGISDWKKSHGGELRVWSVDDLRNNGWRDVPGDDAARLDVLVDFVIGSHQKTERFSMDSGSDWTIFPRDTAETLGVEVSDEHLRPMSTILNRVSRQTDRSYSGPGYIRGAVMPGEYQIGTHKFDAWMFFQQASPFMVPPLLGTASIVEQFYVGFGAGPTILCPINKLAPVLKP